MTDTDTRQHGEYEDQFPGVVWSPPGVGLRVIRTTDFTGTAVWWIQKQTLPTLTTSRWEFRFAAKSREAMEMGREKCGYIDPRFRSFISTLPLKIT